jgi:hypothetical protein
MARGAVLTSRLAASRPSNVPDILNSVDVRAFKACQPFGRAFRIHTKRIGELPEDGDACASSNAGTSSDGTTQTGARFSGLRNAYALSLKRGLCGVYRRSAAWFGAEGPRSGVEKLAFHSA